MINFHTEKFDTPEKRHAASQLAAGVRQEMVANLLVRYPQFTNVSEAVGRFHRPVKGGKHGRGMIGGVLGEPRSGKSFICKHYAGQHTVRVSEDGEYYPVVYLEARADWTPYHMAEQFFWATGAKSVPSMKTSALITAANRRLLRAQTELVVLDDAHFLLLGAKGRVLGMYQSFIKSIADLGSCNILLVGLPGIQGFIENDGQLGGRGDFPHWHVKPLDWSIEDEKEQFMLLLNAIDVRLPFLQSSNLAAPDNALDFYHCSHGMIGRVMNIVITAAYRAINDGTTHILADHLQKAAAERMKVGETYRPFLNRRGNHVH